MGLNIHELTHQVVDQRLHLGQSCHDCSRQVLEPLSGGLINATFKVCSQPSCRPVVLNVLTHPSDRLQQEAYVRQLLSGSPSLPIQRLLDSGTGIFVPGQPPVGFLVKEYLPGDTLHQRFTSHQELGIEGPQQAQLLFDLGKNLALIHQVDLPQFGKITGDQIIGAPDGQTWLDYYRFKTAFRFRHLAEVNPDKQVGSFKASDIQSLLPNLVAVVAQNESVLAKVTHPQLVHHDFHFLNVVADDQYGWYISGILDTENATAGDPAIDLVSVESQLNLAANSYRDTVASHLDYFRDGYQARGQTPPDYQSRRLLYHIPWSVSYFEAVFIYLNPDLHPITPQIEEYMTRHYLLLHTLASGKSLESISMPSIF